MSDILKGDTFVDGQSVTGARLNNLVDLAVVQPAFISGKAAITPVLADYLLFYQTASGLLKKALLSAVPLVNSVALTMPASEFNVAGSPITSAGTLAVTKKNQNANLHFASPDNAVGQPTFRAMVARDLPAEITIPGTSIDWATGLAFTQLLTTNRIFTFANLRSGNTIRVRLQQVAPGNFTVTWPGSVLWVSAIVPTMTPTTGYSALFTFHCSAGFVFGKVDQPYHG